MATRIDLLVALACLTAPFLAPMAQISTPAPRVEDARAREELGTRFYAAFRSWRAGDEDAAAVARSTADELCATFERCDLPRMVEHYATLSPAERAIGFALEERVRDMRSQLERAGEQRLADEEWQELRGELEAELDAACEDSRAIADLGARAHASALRAEYYVALLETRHGGGFGPEDRARLAGQIEHDVRDALQGFTAFDLARAALNPQWTLARIEHYRGRFSSARAAYSELAIRARTVGAPEEIAVAWKGMLSIANDRGDQIEAETCLESLAGMLDAKSDWPLARAWAMRLAHADRAAEEQEFLDRFQAPALSDSSSNAREVRRELALVRAQAFLRLGHLELAREAAAKAALTKGEAFEQRYLEARIELKAGHPQPAIDRIGDPVQLSKGRARNEGAARTLLAEARLKLGDARGARDEATRALSIAEERSRLGMLEPMASADEEARFNFIGEWEGAGLESLALLVRAELELKDPLAAALASEDWQSRSLRGDTEELAELFARTGKTPERVTLTSKHLQAWAGTLELGLVTWVFGADSGAVVHVRKSASGELECTGERIQIGREQLREGVRKLRQRVISGQNTDKLALEIRDVLLPESIRAHIGKPRASTDRLLLLLHGPLEAMPIELLGLGEKTFDDELCLLALPGLPSLEPGVVLKSGFDRWQLLGSPVDGADLEGPARAILPGAEDELRDLIAMWPKALLAKGTQFQRPALEHALLSSDCVHVATHLELKPDEARSRFPAAGLRLNDGDVASAREIARLTPHLPLVVLSACETGGGRYSDGEGLFGVARAFLEGGTRNLVVTLWPVEDQAAHDFAVNFHRALKSGAPPSQATRLARTQLRAAKRSDRDWAAFRFIGRD